MTSEIRKKLQTELLWSFAAKVTALIFYFALHISLARFLGVELFGTWSLFFSLLSIFSIFAIWGINSSAQKYIAKAKDEQGSLYLRNGFLLQIKVSVVISFIFILSIPLLRKIFPALHAEQTIFFLGALYIFFTSILELIKSSFIGLHVIKRFFYSNILEHGAKFLLSIGALLLLSPLFKDTNYLILLISTFCISSAVAILYGVWQHKDSLQASKNNIVQKEIWKYAQPLFIISLGMLVATEVDTLMLSKLSSLHEVGLYAASKKISNQAPQLASILAIGIMPLLSKIHEENKEQAKRMFWKTLKYSSLLAGLSSLGLAVLSPWIIPFLFGAEFQGSVLPMQISCIYIFVVILSVIIGQFLDYQGKAKKRAINLVIMMAINIGLNFFLIPRYGAVGAALGTSIAYIPYVFLNFMEAKKVLAE